MNCLKCGRFMEKLYSSEVGGDERRDWHCKKCGRFIIEHIRWFRPLAV